MKILPGWENQLSIILTCQEKYIDLWHAVELFKAYGLRCSEQRIWNLLKSGKIIAYYKTPLLLPDNKIDDDPCGNISPHAIAIFWKEHLDDICILNKPVVNEEYVHCQSIIVSCNNGKIPKRTDLDISQEDGLIQYGGKINLTIPWIFHEDCILFNYKQLLKFMRQHKKFLRKKSRK